MKVPLLVTLLAPVLLTVSHTMSSAQSPAVSAENATGKEGDGPKYHIKWWYEAPPTLAGVVFTNYAFSQVYSKPNSDTAKVLALNKNDLPFFDRWAARRYSTTAAATSDFFLYGSVPLPFFLLLDKKARREAPAIGMMYVEALAITGSIYSGCNYFLNRYRPEVYDPNVELETRLNGNGKNSFPAGHVATVATATFFGATVYAHYHPHQKGKYYLYGVAILATGATAYLRHEAGKHFPSDIAVGTAIGVLSGVLTPYFHLRKNGAQKRAWNITPDYRNGAAGLGFCYRFN